jgi:putative oxidoreductase
MFKLGNGGLWRQWAPLPLRLVIGYGFLAHGWAKLSRGPAGFAKLLDQIGAPLPELTAWVSTLIEILGGLAILAGAVVAVVSVPLIVMMLVAIFTVHQKERSHGSTFVIRQRRGWPAGHLVRAVPARP